MMFNSLYKAGKNDIKTNRTALASIFIFVLIFFVYAAPFAHTQDTGLYPLQFEPTDKSYIQTADRNIFTYVCHIDDLDTPRDDLATVTTEPAASAAVGETVSVYVDIHDDDLSVEEKWVQNEDGTTIISLEEIKAGEEYEFTMPDEVVVVVIVLGAETYEIWPYVCHIDDVDTPRFDLATVTTDPADAAVEGETVEVYIDIALGYTVSQGYFFYYDQNNDYQDGMLTEVIADQEYEFVMPAQVDQIVQVVFILEDIPYEGYDISTYVGHIDDPQNPRPDLATVTTVPANEAGVGQTVEVYIDIVEGYTVYEGYVVFDDGHGTWLTEVIADQEYEFVMPAQDVAVVFWLEDTTVTEYDLTIFIEGNGSTNPEEGIHTYTEGEEVNVTATSDEGWQFKEWSGDVTGTDPMITVTMDDNRSITAVFIKDDLPSTDANLSSLSVSKGTLIPSFDAAETDYSVEVAYDIESIDITATLSDSNASLTIDGIATESGVSRIVSLGEPGTSTPIDILVTAEDDVTQKTYTITAFRSNIPEPQDHLYASFLDAVYAYDGNKWLPTPVAHAPALALAAHEGNLYGAFGDGIYIYDGISWDLNKITSGVASNMASYDVKLYGCFADATYVYDGTSWTLFTWPTSALASYQGYLYASFFDAVYAFDGNQWIATPVAHAPALALAVHDGKLYGAFEDGIYVYDGSSWDINKITPGVASNMASFDGQLYGCFADATYVYDGTSWTLFTWPTNALAAY